MALVATTISFSTYWHWLVEGLLQVVRLDELGCIAEVDDVMIQTDPNPPSYLVESLQAAGMDTATVHVVSEPFDVLVDELIVPKLHRAGGAAVAGLTGLDRSTLVPQRRKVSRAALQYVDALRDRIGVSGSRPADGRRLYVSRRDAARRRISNEEALESALRAQGFETVVAGELSFAEQVATFRDADMIVGPHGAALANLAFAGSGAAVLELQHPRTERTYYRELAERLGIHYASMVCDVDAASPEDMVADVDAVVATASALRDVR
jgi:capsular polysaccharide biosynthesis protein